MYRNSEDLNPEISSLVAKSKIPLEAKHLSFDVIAKASFGFGDVNACVLFKRFIA